MQKHSWKCLLYYIIVGLIISCSSPEPTKKAQAVLATPAAPKTVQKPVEKKRDLPLTAETAIPFLQRYAAENTENKVRVETPLGSFDILLFDQTPYHRANFIFLTKQNYFDGTYFHRVVPGFIIQGGNSDNTDTGRKRREIGKYLLPPDTRNGLKHHRGVVSMPSSEIENPHKLASPYEFFIVQQSPGAYHLDGNYTVFGKVIRGMEVVDAINALPTDKREWPLTNMRMRVTVLTQ
ncbi:MAG: Putative bifunctional phosphatase/peptidyl-prolyl cis-trans isomerase [Bacteroidota bacterium]|nr:MAG: Putative bifunctional phosphatase/peptidyl-prolyl cis-trans isomerase [Bacteroidota bacterium]